MNYLEYMVANELSLGTLENTVDALLRDGWKCQGGICVIPSGQEQDTVFMQALTREIR
jgi:hypothetical protein